MENEQVKSVQEFMKKINTEINDVFVDCLVTDEYTLKDALLNLNGVIRWVHDYLVEMKDFKNSFE